MNSVLHISEASNIGLHAMLLIASEPARVFSAKEISAALGVSEDHLLKVMRRLCRAELASSTRGPHGGFQLGRPAAKIRLLDIYETIEGALHPKACLLGRPRCDGDCILGDFIVTTNREFQRRLATTSLAGVAGTLRSEHAREAKNH
jgi:Rrf2 family protein